MTTNVQSCESFYPIFFSFFYIYQKSDEVDLTLNDVDQFF